jgi:hypothetical protein
MARSSHATVGVALSTFALAAVVAALWESMSGPSTQPSPADPAPSSSTRSGPTVAPDDDTAGEVQVFTDETGPPLPPCITPESGGTFMCVFEGTSIPR